jgi:hypothetical protein
MFDGRSADSEERGRIGKGYSESVVVRGYGRYRS